MKRWYWLLVVFMMCRLALSSSANGSLTFAHLQKSTQVSVASFSSNFIKKKIRKCGLEERHLERNGYTIQFYDNATELPVLVLLNGFGASTEFQWYKVLPELAESHRVVLVNLLHFGESTAQDSAAFHLVDQVDFLKTLFDELKVSNIRLAGISYGGLVASEFAEKHSALLSELILLDAPTKYLDLPSMQELCESYGLKNVKEFFAPQDHKGLKVQLDAAYHNPPWMPGFVVKSFYREFCEPYRQPWGHLVNALVDNYEQLRQREYLFAGKVTLIWGREDVLVPLSVGQALDNMYPQSELFVIDKCGHLPSLEKPKSVLEILLP